MNHNSRPKETLEKALALNLNPARYGTFAEIGAGQELFVGFSGPVAPPVRSRKAFLLMT